MQRLNDILIPLREKLDVGAIETWELHDKSGITLGRQNSVFPWGGTRYLVETTKDKNPEITTEEIAALERRFGKFWNGGVIQ